MEAAVIDKEGTFKYVLIRLYHENDSSELLVRGFKWGAYHDDIYQETLQEAQKRGMDTECLGGGRIKHEPEKKEIFVYGYSMGYGRADHTKTVEILKKKYADYKITYSNEGY